MVAQKASTTTSSNSNSNTAKNVAESAKNKAEDAVDTLKSKAKSAADNVNVPNSGSQNGSDHYSMSADGMARDAENDSSSGGVGGVFNAIKNVAKKLVD